MVVEEEEEYITTHTPCYHHRQPVIPPHHHHHHHRSTSRATIAGRAAGGTGTGTATGGGQGCGVGAGAGAGAGVGVEGEGAGGATGGAGPGAGVGVEKEEEEEEAGVAGGAEGAEAWTATGASAHGLAPLQNGCPHAMPTQGAQTPRAQGWQARPMSLAELCSSAPLHKEPKEVPVLLPRTERRAAREGRGWHPSGWRS